MSHESIALVASAALHFVSLVLLGLVIIPREHKTPAIEIVCRPEPLVKSAYDAEMLVSFETLAPAPLHPLSIPASEYELHPELADVEPTSRAPSSPGQDVALLPDPRKLLLRPGTRTRDWQMGYGPLGYDDQTLARRLGRACAKKGDLQFSLIWDTFDDLDLHVRTPNGEVVYGKHPRSADGGHLDVDANVKPHTRRPLENIFWGAGVAPTGRFQVAVNLYRNHSTPGDKEFIVRMIIDDEPPRLLRGVVSDDAPWAQVYEFNRFAPGEFPLR